MSESMNSTCPCCKTPHMSVFYRAKSIPINSCQMFSSQEEAIIFPRGDLALGFCKTCGFISNVAFEPSKVDYSTLAPEEQGFSKTFNEYAQRLANRLIQDYDLRNKHISEIGCGRGDFLALLCEMGENYGVGIDPSKISGGVNSKISNRLTFIRDYYSERYSKFLGDFVCCRHTLEHISTTAEFVSSLRNAINDKSNTIVFFEVPDITRILKEVAFWDIYYEHCSYFSLGSLARLFRRCKFEVTRLDKDYFDQYLVVDAKPAVNASGKSFEKEESVKQTAEDVDNFAARCQEKLNFWNKHLERIQAEDKRAVVWGSGSKCVAFMTTLGIKDEIKYIVDINPNRHGKFIPGVGKKIVSPQFLKEYKPEIVIIMNPVYLKEIGQDLDELGIAAELIPCT